MDTPRLVQASDTFSPATIEEAGFTRQQMSEARKVRDAEKASPGRARPSALAGVANFFAEGLDGVFA